MVVLSAYFDESERIKGEDPIAVAGYVFKAMFRGG